MNNLPTDANSRAIQCAKLGNGYNYQEEIIPESLSGIVRFKNVGADNAIIRYSDTTSDGVILSPGETEYFYVDGIVEIVQGVVNVMY